MSVYDYLLGMSAPLIESAIPKVVGETTCAISGLFGPEASITMRKLTKLALDKCETAADLHKLLFDVCEHYKQFRILGGDNPNYMVRSIDALFNPIAAFSSKIDRVLLPSINDGSMTKERWDNLRDSVMLHIDDYIKKHTPYKLDFQDKYYGHSVEPVSEMPGEHVDVTPNNDVERDNQNTDTTNEALNGDNGDN
jgi:hypothetical protein